MNSRDKQNNPRNPSDVPLISDMDVVASQHSLANLAQNKRTSKNNISYNYIMNKSNLSKLSKDQLIALLLKKEHPVPRPRTKKVAPIPFLRRSVKQMVQNYEKNIIQPPLQFRDRPKPWPRNNIIPPPKQFMDKPIVPPRLKKKRLLQFQHKEPK